MLVYEESNPKNRLSTSTREMAKEVSTLEGKVISNKTGWNMGITHLEGSVVRVEFDMELARHGDAKANGQ